MSQSPFPPGPPPSRDAGPWAPPPGPPIATATYGAGDGVPATAGSEGPPREGLAYHLLLRGGYRGTWWRGLIGLLVFAAGMMLLSPALFLAVFALYFVATGQDVGAQVTALTNLEAVTPALLAYLNLALAGMIPIAWLLVRFLHGLRPRWLSSVRPRLRWGYLFACFGLAFVALIATVLVGAVLPSGGSGTEMSGRLNEFTPQARDFLLVVLLLTPLQAAAEEYAFRGYLLQAFGGVLAHLGDGTGLRFLRHPAFAVVITSLLFALAHGTQDAPIFFDRFAFGVVAGTLVIVTGGLEAGIAMHVLNNFLAFGVALAFGDMTSALTPTGGTWWSIPVTLTQSLVYLVLAWLVARKMGLARRSDPAVLAGPEARV